MTDAPSRPDGSPDEDSASIERLERRLRRGRLTLPVYGAGGLYFLVSGFLTRAWTPALAMVGLCALAGYLSLRIRRRTRRRLEELRGPGP